MLMSQVFHHPGPCNPLRRPTLRYPAYVLILSLSLLPPRQPKLPNMKCSQRQLGHLGAAPAAADATPHTYVRPATADCVTYTIGIASSEPLNLHGTGRQGKGTFGECRQHLCGCLQALMAMGCCNRPTSPRLPAKKSSPFPDLLEAPDAHGRHIRPDAGHALKLAGRPIDARAVQLRLAASASASEASRRGGG